MAKPTMLVVIPARAGSKGIRNKNIQPLAGKPLIAWSIEAALQANSPSKVIVSTDCETIAATAKHYGAEVPFLRPKALAQDNTPGDQPILHALQTLQEKNEVYQAIMVLQPTSPLRTADDIDLACHQLNAHQAQSLVSVTENKENPFLSFTLTKDHQLQAVVTQQAFKPRQAYPPTVRLNGAIYCGTVTHYQENKTFLTATTLAYSMPFERSIDIDTLEDWQCAERLLLASKQSATVG